jgi:hypothetical protein
LQAIRELEDKFHGLELKHVLRKYNEAANTLAKAASNRMPVPNSVFASDLRVPSVCCDEDDHPSAPEPPKAMALGEAPKPNLEDPDRRIPILEWMVEGKLPTNST